MTCSAVGQLSANGIQGITTAPRRFPTGEHFIGLPRLEDHRLCGWRESWRPCRLSHGSKMEIGVEAADALGKTLKIDELEQVFYGPWASEQPIPSAWSPMGKISWTWPGHLSRSLPCLSRELRWGPPIRRRAIRYRQNPSRKDRFPVRRMRTGVARASHSISVKNWGYATQQTPVPRPVLPGCAPWEIPARCSLVDRYPSIRQYGER